VRCPELQLELIRRGMSTDDRQIIASR